MKPETDRWQKLLGAVKATRAAARSAEGDIEPPVGFVTRVAARGADLRREQAIALWRRWSIRAALGSTCLFVVAAIYASATKDPGQILPIPAIEFPHTAP